MTSRVRRPAIIAAVGAALLGVMAAAPPAASAATGTATCQAPGVAWRVDYQTQNSVYGPVLTATALQRRTLPGGSWTDASTETWELRRDDLPSETPGGFTQEPGDLSTLQGIPVVTYLSPRFVAPDGACTVYTHPFSNGSANQPKVVAAGDSLTASLNDATYNQTHIQGYIEGNFNAAGIRAEVEGQSGKYWLAPPDSHGQPRTGIDKAGYELLDEVRGLLAHDPDGFVLALGANDAGQVAWISDAAERQTRINAAKAAIGQYVSELTAAGKCVVLITPPDNLAHYWGSDPWLYAWSAQQLTHEMRSLANASATDLVKLQDFAEHSWDHHSYMPNNPQVWFGSDDIHLNAVGRLAYTSEFAQAAEQCV
ncbi:SGNH/GDSL hydrolase family protein [Actinomadura sp. 7K534]|uniref:SGNH/GDSL hydrolase family protein n=1 Tax=Actinomadura sp. 7K534 TaxID=2530366 RepID=UPI00104ABCC2|nr:SGNH/GDSL hydrolase family protein [Actinomadura sp. 7K534]TDB97539.1 SGNH/GDSL hydrolase family protein [Actinomadura sp. 7K534]